MYPLKANTWVNYCGCGKILLQVQTTNKNVFWECFHVVYICSLFHLVDPHLLIYGNHGNSISRKEKLQKYKEQSVFSDQLNRIL